MNRAQRRLKEKEIRLDNKKNNVVLTKNTFNQLQTDISNNVSTYTVDIMLTSFALTLHEDCGFTLDQITTCLNKIDYYMGLVNEGTITVDDIREKVKEETGLWIRS